MLRFSCWTLLVCVLLCAGCGTPPADDDAQSGTDETIHRQDFDAGEGGSLAGEGFDDGETGELDIGDEPAADDSEGDAS